MFNDILERMEKTAQGKDFGKNGDDKEKVMKMTNFFDNLTLLVKTAGYL